MLRQFIAEYEDNNTIQSIAPFLMWHVSPPDALALGQWSTARDHVAINIEMHPKDGVIWYAWRYVPGTESSIEHLSSEVTALDEMEARVAAEMWVRKNYEPIKRRYREALAGLREKAVKKGDAVPVLPWYRLFMIICLVTATIIFGILVAPVSAWRFIVTLIIVMVVIGVATHQVIDRSINTLYNWVKKGKYIVKEVR